MLAPDQARQMLKDVQVENEAKRRLAAAAALPKPLAVAGDLLFKEETDVRDWQSRFQRMAQAAGMLDHVGTADRRRFFKALFPGLSQYVEKAWQIQITRLPYQTDYYRRAFRAPRNPELTQMRRGQWLANLFRHLAPYRQDITWIAAWSGNLSQYVGMALELAVLLAAAAEDGTPTGDEVFNILLASARGEHEIGVMGRHVIRALLIAARPEGWDLVEKLLIAAQRQEGLRQVILESVDEAHPDAFPRLVRLILDQNLLRFSAAVRAVNVWFGMNWTVENVKAIETFLARFAGYLGHPEGRDEALRGDAEGVYMALWLRAFDDVTTALTAAQPFLSDPVVKRRFAAVHLVGQCEVSQARLALLPMLADPDLRIVARVLTALGRDKELAGTDYFERLEQVLTRLTTNTRTLKPILWPSVAQTINREQIADTLIDVIGDRSSKRLLPYLRLMSTTGRGRVPELLAQGDKNDAEVRQTLFALLADQSQWVRERALHVIADLSVTDQEAVELESLLHRKASDLRRAVLSILIRRADAQVLESVDRLLAAKTGLERSGGLELLRLLMDAGRQVKQSLRRADTFRADYPRVSEDEAALLDAIVTKEEEAPTLDNALGLIDPSQQTPPTHPLRRKRRYITAATIASLESLDALIEQHSRIPVTYTRWKAQEEALLGNMPLYAVEPDANSPLDQDIARLPLHDVWKQWWAQRPANLRDEDGLELVRALGLTPLRVIVKRVEDASVKRVAEVVLNNGDWEGSLKYPQLTRVIVTWLLRLHPLERAADFLLDAAETALALIPKGDLARLAEPPKYSHEAPDLWWRQNTVVMAWLGLARRYGELCPQVWTAEHVARLWRLTRWIDVPGVEARRLRPPLKELLTAFKVGAATEADVIDHLLGPREDTTRYTYASGFPGLSVLSGRRPSAWFAVCPGLGAIVDRCRKRIVAVEARRGEMPTAASAPSKQLRAVYGMDTLFSLVRDLGRQDLQRGWSFSNGLSKQAVLSHLIRVTLPAESDTLEAFAKQVSTARISEKRLLDLAVFAPHWAGHVEHVLGWKGLQDAIWWVHAHTKDAHWYVDHEVRELWTAEVTERTPLTAQDLIDGAVDVDWFWRVYKSLGPQRWETLYDSAKYAAGGTGYARAKLFADAMLGQVEKQAMIDRFMKKRHQDSLRALGLLPLAKGAKREADILDRYQHIQEFLRTGKSFGSQRRANEKLAAGIAMQNLARTAGYPDPTRLEWAMEGRANADMSGGSLVAAASDTTVTLTIDSWGEPALSVEKQGKRLKSIPPKLKKDPQIAHLLERKQEIKRQSARMRQSLEQAMCRGDAFTADELRSLIAHAILAPMLEHLIFIGDSSMGYPVEGGKSLQRYDGSITPLPKKQALRIAHPHDLLESGEWHEWQRECFLAERIQPFKQVFRELYVLTDAERTDGNLSRRYAGHQVQPKQAAALLGQRGWVIHPEEGARRTFHEENLSVWLSGLSGFFTPVEVEGETLEGVHFSRRGEWKPVPLTEVPPRIFSEAMRDLDLVVSVAHMGGVDPEASASTVEMRASLVQETCKLLKIDNVRIAGSHVLVDGKLGNYSVHLGSAVVHRQPGGAVCIIPVHSQHRGRIFLPFADDDPRTAEVVSKTILLARDHAIQDPTILEQLLVRH